MPSNKGFPLWFKLCVFKVHRFSLRVQVGHHGDKEVLPVSLALAREHTEGYLVEMRTYNMLEK